MSKIRLNNFLYEISRTANELFIEGMKEFRPEHRSLYLEKSVKYMQSFYSYERNHR